MTSRWLAVPLALMLVWTFFLGAALASGRSFTSSCQICLCLICQGGPDKCHTDASSSTGDSHHHKSCLSCDLNEQGNFLVVGVTAVLPVALTTPMPVERSVALEKAPVLLGVTPTLAPDPLESPPRIFLS